MKGGGNKSAVREVRETDARLPHESKVLQRRPLPERRVARGTSARGAGSSRASAGINRDGASRFRRDGVLA